MDGPRPELRLLRAEASPAAGPRATLELAGLGTALVFVAVILARLPSWRAELGTFQALASVAFVAWGVALARAGRCADDRATVAVVLAVAAAARLALWPVTPTLSDDLYRYLWEGRVVAAGANPYALAPASESLAALRDAAIHPRVNHPHLAAIYPPLALAGFALVAALSDTVLAMKAWVLGWDLALCAVLVAWARASGAGAAMAIAYAWNPLVLVEFAGSGHHDPTALLPMVLAFLWAARRPAASAVALAAATLTKFAPLLALPFLWRRWPWRARLLALGTIAAGLAAQLAWTGALDPGRSGLAAYAVSWRHNDLAFGALEWLARSPERARLLAVAAVAAAIALLLVRRAPAAAGAARAQQVALLVSPVLHPWYLGWVLVFQPVGWSVPWLVLSWTALVSYGPGAPPAAGSAWHPGPGLRLLEYGLPAAAGLAAWLWSRRRGGGDRGGAAHRRTGGER